MRRISRRMPLLFVVAAGLAGFGADAPPKDPASSLLAKLSKVETAIADQKGKVVLVDFWATWCTPCVKKFPHVVELHEKYSEKGLACLAVSFDDPDDSDDVKKFLKEKKATFPCFILEKPSKAENETLEKRFGFEGGIPHMVLFDRTGNKIWDSSLEKNEKDAQAKLEKLIRVELDKKK